jgi:hypothetical protein
MRTSRFILVVILVAGLAIDLSGCAVRLVQAAPGCDSPGASQAVASTRPDREGREGKAAARKRVFLPAVLDTTINSIWSVTFQPPPGATLQLNEMVHLTFQYSTNESGGVVIALLPYTQGQPSPYYVWSGSDIYPCCRGRGTAWFTTFSGPVSVDQVQLEMWPANGGHLLWRAFLPVRYLFAGE